MSARNDRARSRSACSASHAETLGQVRHGEEELAQGPVEIAAHRSTAGRRAAGRSPRHAGSAPASACDRSPSARDIVRLQARRRAPCAASLVASIRAGSDGGDALGDAAAPLLALLDGLPVGDDLVRTVGIDVTEHVRVAVDELVVHTARHPGQVEAAGLGGQAGVEDDLEEQVAQLLLEVAYAMVSPSGPSTPPARRAPHSSPQSRWGMSEPCVWTRSQGQRSRSVSMSATSWATAAPAERPSTGADAGTNSEVRWSGSPCGRGPTSRPSPPPRPRARGGAAPRVVAAPGHPRRSRPASRRRAGGATSTATRKGPPSV